MNSRLSQFSNEAQVIEYNCKKKTERLTTIAAVGIALAIIFFVLTVILTIVASRKKKTSNTQK